MNECTSSTRLHSPSPTCVAVLVLWCGLRRGHFPGVCSALPCAQPWPTLGSPLSLGKNWASRGQETYSLKGHSQPGDPSLSLCLAVSPWPLRLSPERRGLCGQPPQNTEQGGEDGRRILTGTGTPAQRQTRCFPLKRLLGTRQGLNC